MIQENPAAADRMLRWLLLGAALLALGTLNGQLGGIGGDNAQYILLARSIATGQGYRTIQEPGSPLHTSYPFGFPLMLTPIVALWGSHAFLPMHGMVVAWALLSLVLWFRWVREETRSSIALATVGCLATTPLWVGAYQQILSEFPYLAFSLMALLWVRRRGLSASVGSLGFLALLLLAGYFTRTAGAALIVTVVGWLLWSHYRWFPVWRTVFFLGGLLLPISAWHLRNVWLAHGPATHYAGLFFLKDPYQPHLGTITPVDLFQRILGNLQYYVSCSAEALVWPVSLMDPAVGPWAGGVIALGIAGGFLLRLGRKSVVEWYVVATMAMALAWPYRDLRFFLPILPWIWLYLLKAGEKIAPRLRRLLLIGLLTGNVAGCFWLTGLNLTQAQTPFGVRQFLAAHDWLRANSSEEAVILSRKPAVTALLAERKSVGIPFAVDTQAVWAKISEEGVTHLLMDGIFLETRRYLLPAVRQHPDRFEPEIRFFGQTAILRLRGKRTGGAG